MEIKIGMYFQGIVNGKVIRIVNASDQAVTYADVETGKIFTVGRKMFERCYLTRI
ncbi:MAG: hypothetical protein IJB81_09130 [Clostridia bacterium]|nr:hypothetical protein [Clostridia bacterium]